MRTLLTAAITVLAIYLSACLGLWAFQDRLVFFPDRTLGATPSDVGLDYQDQWIDTPDGVRLHAWWLPGSNDAPAVLFLHGNAGNISHRLETLSQLAGLGVSVLIPDYRGYGLSTGAPSEAGTYVDAQAALEHMRDALGIDAARLVLMGRSLGASVAVWLARRNPPAALIIESGFTSARELAARHYPLFPVRLLTRFDYDSLSAIGGVDCPVLVIHSRDDEIVPFTHAQRLLAAAPEPKRMLELRGGHNDAFLRSADVYLNGLAQFLETAFRAPPPTPGADRAQ